MLRPGDFSKYALPAYLRKGNLGTLRRFLSETLPGTARGNSVGGAAEEFLAGAKSLPEFTKGIGTRESRSSGVRKLMNEALRHGESGGFRPVEMPARLESFKSWKATGELPVVSKWSKHDEGITHFTRGSKRKGHGLPYERSDELVDVFHGTSPDKIERTTKSPTSFIAGDDFGKKQGIIPGQLGTHTQGAFVSTFPEEAAFYGPSMIKGKVPKKNLIQAIHSRTGRGIPSGEHVLPRSFVNKWKVEGVSNAGNRSFVGNPSAVPSKERTLNELRDYVRMLTGDF